MVEVGVEWVVADESLPPNFFCAKAEFEVSWLPREASELERATCDSHAPARLRAARSPTLAASADHVISWQPRCCACVVRSTCHPSALPVSASSHFADERFDCEATPINFLQNEHDLISNSAINHQGHMFYNILYTSCTFSCADRLVHQNLGNPGN